MPANGVSLIEDPFMDIQLNWTTGFAAAGYIVANPAVRQALAWTGRAALTVDWKRMAVPASVVLVVLALLVQGPVAAQSRRGGVRQSASKAAGTDPSLTAAVATFNGTIKAISKKDITVDLDSGNTVEFKLSKKTEFFVGEKKVTVKDLTPETLVKIEGNKDGFGVLTATKLMVKLEPGLPPPQ